MKKQPLSGLSIRTGVVRNLDTGYILACDPEMEENEIMHTKTFTWKAGHFEEGSLNFNAHTCCLVSVPEPAWVMLAGFGEYAITSKNKSLAGKIFDGQPIRSEYGTFRVVTEISGRAYAAGLRGMAYRLDDFVKWVRMDKGLPSSFDITAIDGFGKDDIYAAGYSGALWHFDGHDWSKLDLPTNVNLTALKCAGDGNVYVAGYNGILIRGKGSSWNIIAENETLETLWDLEWFGGELYISSMLFIYQLKNGELELADFDDDPPDSCYHLSTAEGVMWSIGANDVMSFDGKTWTRIV